MQDFVTLQYIEDEIRALGKKIGRAALTRYGRQKKIPGLIKLTNAPNAPFVINKIDAKAFAKDYAENWVSK